MIKRRWVRERRVGRTRGARRSRSPRLRQLRQHAHCTGRFRRQRRPNPFGGSIAGAAENLFGTTLSANSVSTAFELSGTGIQVIRARPPSIASMAMVTRACCRRTSYICEMNGTGQIDSGSAGNPKPRVIGSPILIESTCPICSASSSTQPGASVHSGRMRTRRTCRRHSPASLIRRQSERRLDCRFLSPPHYYRSGSRLFPE